MKYTLFLIALWPAVVGADQSEDYNRMIYPVLAICQLGAICGQGKVGDYDPSNILSLYSVSRDLWNSIKDDVTQFDIDLDPNYGELGKKIELFYSRDGYSEAVKKYNDPKKFYENFLCEKAKTVTFGAYVLKDMRVPHDEARITDHVEKEINKVLNQ